MGAGEIPILFADEHLLVVDKPAGLLVVAAPGRRARTLVDRVGEQLGARVHAVHRLDEPTSGVVLLARDLETRAALEALFAAHRVERTYLALASRMPTPAAGTIESRLQETAAGVMVSVDSAHGARAVTHYRAVVRRGRHVLVECRLETGRRNQIRAHLAELGCPICGDRKYGWRRRGPDDRFPRVMLHAWRLAFDHPITGAPVFVEAPPVEAALAPPA